MKIYLDNCCFNRPYDDQSYLQIELETEAKLFIQDEIKKRKLKLVSSFILLFENSKNPNLNRKLAIKEFIDNYSSEYISIKLKDEIAKITQEILKTGIKWKDATHLACAIYSNCEYFLTTDKKLLNKNIGISIINPSICIINPLNFIEIIEEL